MHISQALADVAFEQYEAASATAAAFLRGHQMPLDAWEVFARRDEWMGIYLACEVEASRHGC